jgi:hypothetical protein
MAEIKPYSNPIYIELEIFWVTRYIPGTTNKLNTISSQKIFFLKNNGSIKEVNMGVIAIHNTPTDAFDAFIDA